MENENPKSSFVSFFAKLNIFKSMAEKDILGEVIKKIIYVLVFLLPLWFLPITLNTVEFNKQVLMVLLIVIASILWLVKILNQGEIKWKSNLLDILMGAFAIIYILATIFSIRPYGSLVGWSDHLSGSLINVLCFVALYFIIKNNLNTAKELFNIVLTLLISSALVSIIGLLQMWKGFIFPWDFTKTVSFTTIGSINSLGIFSAVILVFVTALLFAIKKGKIKLFLILLGLLNLLILININFWVLWIVLAIGMAAVLFFGLVHMVRSNTNVNWVALPMLLLAIALIFIFFKPVLPFKTNLPIEVGLNYRGGWAVIKNTVMQKPILGTGPETFAFNYAKYKPEGINSTAFWNIRFSNPPTEIFSLVSDTGILGFLSFLAILVWFIFRAVSNLVKEKEETGSPKKLLSIAIFSAWLTLAVAWFLYPQNLVLMFMFWLLFSLYWAIDPSGEDKIYNLRKSPKILLIASFSFIVLVVLVIGLMYIEGIKFISEITYKRGLDFVQVKGDLEGGINKMIRATVTNPYEDNTYRAISQLFLYKLGIDNAREDLSQQDKANLLQIDAINAINSAAQTTILSPKDASNWLLRGQIYRQLIAVVNGASDWAESAYNEAIKLEPANPFAYLELGRLYTNRADLIASQANKDQAAKKKWDEYMATALTNFDKAIGLKPNYAPAHFEEAVVYDKQGKLKQAIAKMEINRQLLPNDSGTAFQLGVLYYRAEDYNKAKGEFIRAIVLDDNFSNARYFLGMLYDRENNKEDAIDQFDRIQKLNPDNEQIKQILANLKAGKPALGSKTLGPPKEPSKIPIEEQPK